jgi:hypothetical protein
MKNSTQMTQNPRHRLTIVYNTWPVGRAPDVWLTLITPLLLHCFYMAIRAVIASERCSLLGTTPFCIRRKLQAVKPLPSLVRNVFTWIFVSIS